MNNDLKENTRREANPFSQRFAERPEAVMLCETALLQTREARLRLWLHGSASLKVLAAGTNPSPVSGSHFLSCHKWIMLTNPSYRIFVSRK